jgi:hypothetical protein
MEIEEENSALVLSVNVPSTTPKYQTNQETRRTAVGSDNHKDLSGPTKLKRSKLQATNTPNCLNQTKMAVTKHIHQHIDAHTPTQQRGEVIQSCAQAVLILG